MGTRYKIAVAFTLAFGLGLQPAWAEMCPAARAMQAAIDVQGLAEGTSRFQFDLAEVQNPNFCGVYQRFAVNRNEVDGDTAYALSRLIYATFKDERILGEDAASAAQAQRDYFNALATTPRPVAVHEEEGYITMLPPTAAELASAPEYQPLRAADPAGFQRLLQLVATPMADNGASFNARSASIMGFLQQHWHVLAVAVPSGDDCKG